jgi:hypothetical protein
VRASRSESLLAIDDFLVLDLKVEFLSTERRAFRGAKSKEIAFETSPHSTIRYMYITVRTDEIDPTIQRTQLH